MEVAFIFFITARESLSLCGVVRASIFVGSHGELKAGMANGYQYFIPFCFVPTLYSGLVNPTRIRAYRHATSQRPPGGGVVSRNS